ncbi:circadian clock protein KaiC [Methanobacterium sp. MBAC-LM]|uniref:circadian clock protein KaiC n=1 Tax=Methanobacterium sp. MBAC-LM TaxID=3412034 RepID=UPI003C74E1C2
MSNAENLLNSDESILEKTLTGIEGLDDITGGGLPQGRPTLVCGAAGCGKTIFAMEFIVHGAERGEPGVFVSFEESIEDLKKNFISMNPNLNDLIDQNKISFDYVHIERSEIEETGEYDLEGLFIRLGYAIDSIGAKRVVLDTVEALFSGFSAEALLRAELRRLFKWLKNKGVTAVITGESGEKTLTRYGLEEYVADCVILLNNPVANKITTRNLRIVKYRGSSHGTNEYPFLIDEKGITVLPITSVGLDHNVSNEYVSTGIKRLDSMMDGKGFYKGSSILVTGNAGTGKSSFAAQFVDAACERGKKCIYLAFEESPEQIIRNMRSIGIDLGHWVDKGLLKFHATRPTLYGLEIHLVTIYKLVNEIMPDIVVIDPMSNLITAGSLTDVKSMLTRLIDFLKDKQITSLATSLSLMGQVETDVGVSSLMDTWIDLRSKENNGERNRTLDIIKSRGMVHSNQMREFLITSNGIEVEDVYIGPEGMLTGSARISQIALEKAQKLMRKQEIERKRREIEHKRESMEAQIAEIKSKFEVEEEELEKILEHEKLKEEVLEIDRNGMARMRKADKRD